MCYYLSCYCLCNASTTEIHYSVVLNQQITTAFGMLLGDIVTCIPTLGLT